jgi:hypothetical protein
MTYRRPNSEKFPAIALLAGNAALETGSYLTAHTTIQSSRTAETVVDRKGAVSAGIPVAYFQVPGLCRHLPSHRAFLSFSLRIQKFRSRRLNFGTELIVPGWFSTYWVKMLSDIEVLDKLDWMTSAYLIPDAPYANIVPGQPGVKNVPINRMVPRSFFTNALQFAAGSGYRVDPIPCTGTADEAPA